MSVVPENMQAQITVSGTEQDSDPFDSKLSFAVIYTSLDATITALKKAEILASRLHGRVDLIVTQVVPYPLPLNRPPVSLKFCRRRLRAISSDSPVETTVRLFLCRDQLATLKRVLRPHSLVVVGGRGRWWALGEKCLARRLRRAGHDVIFTETE